MKKKTTARLIQLRAYLEAERDKAQRNRLYNIAQSYNESIEAYTAEIERMKGVQNG